MTPEIQRNLYQTPEQRWGHLKKNLHFTGEISKASLMERLLAFDSMALTKIVKIINRVAHNCKTSATVLVVGSMANLSYVRKEESDVDLLVCFEDENLRETVAEKVNMQLLRDKNYLIDTETMRGSVSGGVGNFYTPVKLYVTPHFKDIKSPRSFIDITFLGNFAGSTNSELEFMRKHSLAFCLV